MTNREACRKETYRLTPLLEGHTHVVAPTITENSENAYSTTDGCIYKVTIKFREHSAMLAGPPPHPKSYNPTNSLSR